MRETLHEYLLERPAGASPRELLDLIFTQPGADPEFGPRFLQTMLGQDPRFVWRPADGTWNAQLHATLARPLSDTRFVVVDLETTGVGTSPGAIIEIGAVRVHAGRPTAEFQQLVRPSGALPRFITSLTGIDAAMLAEQPGIAEVWPRFLAFLGDDVLVAHNANYDLGFLSAAAVAFSGRPVTNPHLCTLRLARRLVPELRRRGLDALAAHFGIPQYDRHRALGDARITVEILFHLLERLMVRGIARLDQALDLQQQARDGRPFICRLPRRTLESLPPAPGIYRFFDADGRLLYIGKAKSLRERVSSYLSNAAGHSDKTLDLIRHAREVRVELADSELEAALAEAEAIQRQKPPYNRLGKHLPRIGFLKLSLGDEHPRLSITDRASSRRAHYVGPFRHRKEAQRVLALLTRLFRVRTCAGSLQPDATATPCLQGQVGACTAPCAARVTVEDYRQQVAACLRLLGGDTAPAEHELTQRREALAATLRFEAAAKAQRDLETLQLLARRQRTLSWMAASQHLLILQPTADCGAVLVYVMASGRLAMRTRVNDAREMAGLADRVRACLIPAASRTLQPDEVDGTTIIAAWLRDRGEREGCVWRIDDPTLPATQIAEWQAACASLLLPGARELAAADPQAQGE